jgi:nucleotide-binding universal stress UspA family protein
MTDVVGWEISKQEAASYLERLRAHVATASGQPVDVVLEQGHPAERIEALGRRIGASLMILASHGEGGVASWNLGSTVQQVLSVAKGSVFVARSLPQRVASTPRRVLVPLDGSVRTESVLPMAARMAYAEAAEVLLVHVVVEPIPNRVLAASEDVAIARELARRLEVAAKRYLDHLAEHLLRDVPSVRTVVKRQADEGRCLLDLIEREGVDLVVLSAHGASCDPARTFGSVTAQLLWHSPAPLLVIQDLEEIGLGAVRNGEEVAPPTPRGSFGEDAT